MFSLIEYQKCQKKKKAKYKLVTILFFIVFSYLTFAIFFYVCGKRFRNVNET